MYVFMYVCYCCFCCYFSQIYFHNLCTFWLQTIFFVVFVVWLCLQKIKKPPPALGLIKQKQIQKQNQIYCSRYKIILKTKKKVQFFGDLFSFHYTHTHTHTIIVCLCFLFEVLFTVFGIGMVCCLFIRFYTQIVIVVVCVIK